MYTYTPGIPNPGDFPADSQPLLLGNFQYVNSFGSRDHQFTQLSSNTNDGTHKQITLSNLGSTPGFSGANSVLYAKLANSVTQLFYNNSAGDVQLTSTVPVVSSNGSTYLPGGILIQWGSTNGNSSPTIVTYPIAYTTAYQVVANSSDSARAIGISAVGNANFTFIINNPTSGLTVRWTSIGLA